MKLELWLTDTGQTHQVPPISFPPDHLDLDNLAEILISPKPRCGSLLICPSFTIYDFVHVIDHTRIWTAVVSERDITAFLVIPTKVSRHIYRRATLQ